MSLMISWRFSACFAAFGIKENLALSRQFAKRNFSEFSAGNKKIKFEVETQQEILYISHTGSETKRIFIKKRPVGWGVIYFIAPMKFDDQVR
jgi:hypothetical protein